MDGLPERRREEILKSATEIFAREGYPRTDLEAVADRLGVGKGTIYRYFPTKEALFFAAVDRGMRLLREQTDREADRAEDPLQKIVRATQVYLRFFDEHPGFVELFLQERAQFRHRRRATYFVHRDAHLGPWQELLRGLIARGRIRRIPVERITDVFNAALYGAIFTNAFEGRRRSPDRQARDILDIVLKGILESANSAKKEKRSRVIRSEPGEGSRS